MVFSEPKDLPGNTMMEQAVQAEMRKAGTNRIEFFSESLDAARFSDPGHQLLFRDYLEKKYAGENLDLVMAFMARDFALISELPASVISNTPVVFVAISELAVPPELVNSGFAGIVQRFDIEGTLRLMFRLQPETRRVLVVGGLSRTDNVTIRRIEEKARAVDGIQFEFWTNRAIGEIHAELASLPDDTTLLLSTVHRDVSGQSFYTVQIAQMLAPLADAPLYVLGASQIGSGAVGGAVVDFDNLGVSAGKLATQVLGGTPTKTLAIQERTKGTPMVDWRALRRWKLRDSRLPVDCVVRYRPHSLWEEHRWFIIGTAAVILAQALTIAGMLLQRAYRRKAEARLLQSQEARALLASIVESSEDAIIRKTLNRKVVTWNRAAEQLFGYKSEEIVGKGIDLIIPPELLKEEDTISNRLQRGEPVRHYETIRLRKNGTRVDVALTLSPIRDESGTIAGVSEICRDITDRKEAEAQIQQQRTELSHVARVSTMGQLAAALAHELNQPLGAILRNAEAAELFLNHEPPDLQEIRAIVSDIRKDDQRAGEVIDRMRALLKRRSLESKPLKVRELLEETLALARSDALSRRVKLTLEPSSTLPDVCGDRVHLQQVLLNLIINGMDAVHGSANGHRSVIVRSALNSEGEVEVAVRDSGVGIPPEKLSLVFAPFFTTKPEGMGMGLAISRTIIEAHGGKLKVENNESGGATFRFTLPPNGSEKG